MRFCILLSILMFNFITVVNCWTLSVSECLPLLAFQPIFKLIFYFLNALSVWMKCVRWTFFDSYICILLWYEPMTYNLVSLVVLYFEGPVDSVLLDSERQRCCKHTWIDTVLQPKTFAYTYYLYLYTYTYRSFRKRLRQINVN